MMHLGVITQSPNDGCSWYRSLGPLGRLRRQFPDLFRFAPLMPSESPDWSSLYQVDVLFMQRPNSEDALGWALATKEAGRKLWVDYDDDLFHLPVEHPSYHQLRAAWPLMQQIIQMADVVSVSTPALEAVLSRLNMNVHVIPNAIDETLSCPRARDPDTYDPKWLAWRGSVTHQEDLVVGRELMTDPAYTVQYFGHNPPWVRAHDLMTPWAGVPHYLQGLRESLAGALVVPLRDNALNRSKSNCAWLEATWAGLATAHISDGEPLSEFCKPGILSESQLREASPDELAAARDESLSYVLDNLTLESVNLKRRALLEGL